MKYIITFKIEADGDTPKEAAHAALAKIKRSNRQIRCDVWESRCKTRLIGSGDVIVDPRAGGGE